MIGRLVSLLFPTLVICQFDPTKWLTGGNLGGLLGQNFNPLPARCTLLPDVGRTRGDRPASTRFFFNSTSGECETFQYMGRGGNRNNFRDVFSCMRSCGCRQQVDGGMPCNPPGMPVTRYYFDGFLKICNTFDHTGCGGNSNHFSNMMDCIITCGSGGLDFS